MVATALIAAGALGTAGSSIAGLFANQDQVRRQQQLAEEQYNLTKSNMNQQALVQAMVNQLARAGSTDSFGTTIKYDPATNTWNTTLGPKPQAAQTSALDATIQQNTTDRARQELINQVAMERASRAGPAADAAIRDLSSFRPMQGNELTGLLGDQATTAARQAYDPLRADVLRATARTGTAAGPVLAELGRSEAGNLRQSLIDAQVQGMTGVGNINNQRLQGLTGRASAALGAATPQASQLPTTPIQDPGSTNLENQLAANAQRQAGLTTANSGTNVNAAAQLTNPASTQDIARVPDSNFNLEKISNALQSLGQATKSDGSLTKLAGLFGSGGGSGARAMQQGQGLLDQGIY